MVKSSRVKASTPPLRLNLSLSRRQLMSRAKEDSKEVRVAIREGAQQLWQEQQERKEMGKLNLHCHCAAVAGVGGHYSTCGTCHMPSTVSC